MGIGFVRESGRVGTAHRPRSEIGGRCPPLQEATHLALAMYYKGRSKSPFPVLLGFPLHSAPPLEIGMGVLPGKGSVGLSSRACPRRRPSGASGISPGGGPPRRSRRPRRHAAARMSRLSAPPPVQHAGAGGLRNRLLAVAEGRVREGGECQACLQSASMSVRATRRISARSASARSGRPSSILAQLRNAIGVEVLRLESDLLIGVADRPRQRPA